MHASDAGRGRIAGLFKSGSAGIEGKMFLVKELPIIIVSSSLTLWYTLKLWTDLCPVPAITCDGPNMDFDKMDAPVALIEWLV